ncbi:hypothetical protein HZC31_00290 [Candidatus Woesearchaeota archaeon]|nr:hypothetical protein [Candidatus Woesearchaeota archaeon]
MWQRKIKRYLSSFFSFFALAFILLFVFSLQGTLTGKAVIVLDEGVTAEQIAEIATLASSGDETKMLSEVDLSQGGLLIFTRLDNGGTAAIKERDGNFYITGNVHDAVAVMQSADYKLLVEEYGVVEIVDGQIVVEEVEEEVQEEVVEEVVEEKVVEEVREEIIEEVQEEAEEVQEEEEPTSSYCKETETGVKGWSEIVGGKFSSENSCFDNGAQIYARVYSCGVYDQGKWGKHYYAQVTEALCRYGCDSGKCLKAEDALEFSDACIDTDGGDTFDKFGAVTFAGEVYEDQCDSTFYGDKKARGALLEYSCSDSGNLRLVQQKCTYGCNVITGTCQGNYLYGSPIVKISGDDACKDTDAGEAYDGVGRAGTVTLNDESYADSCEQGKSLIEYSCINGQDLGKRRYTCSYACADNACPQSYTEKVEVLLPVQEKVTGDCTSTDTGVTGKDRSGKKRTYEHYCGAYTTGIGAYETYHATVAYCDEDNFPALRSYDCEKGYVCSADGMSCVEGEASCEDSDNGIDTSTSGVVQYLTASGESGMGYDECTDDKTLTEWYCEGDTVQSKKVQCKEYCYGTVCDTMSLECSDTETGADPAVAGYLTYYSLDGTTTAYEDTCTADGKGVTDWYCDGKDVQSTVFSCDGSCSYGSCTASEAPFFSPITTVDEFFASTQDWYYDMKIVIPSKGSTSDYLAALALVGKYGYPLVKDTAVSDWRTMHAIVVGGSSVNSVSKAVIAAGASQEGAYYIYQDPTYYGTVLVVGSDDPKETRKAVKELVKR